MSQPRLIEIRFILNRERQIPAGLWQKDSETEQEKIDRLFRNKSTGISGQEVIESTDKVFLFDFVHDLLDNDYDMVDGYWRYQIMGDRQQKPVARFIFVHHDHLEDSFLNNELPKEVGSAQKALVQLCLRSMWCAQVWENPFFENQKPVDGEHAISVNLIGRQSLFDQYGKHTGVWARDESGEVIQDEDGNPKEKIYTVPNFRLCFKDSKISLEKEHGTFFIPSFFLSK